MKDPLWPLELVKKAIRLSPAYRKFIESNQVGITQIETMEDFKQLPIMDKAYLINNPRRDLFVGGNLPVSASCSSGSSGQPTYWFRSESDDQAAAMGYQHLIADVLKIRKEEPVLALVCFAMGSWVAGTLTVDCLKLIAKNGFNISIFPAGIDKEDGLNALLNLGPEFKHVLIYGYPPLLLDFVSEAHRRSIPMGEKVKIIPAGDKNSEEWRDTIARLANCPLENVVSFYGSADALYMACETPLSFLIKREAQKNPALYSALFGDTHAANIPGMYQYNPDNLFLEEVDGELILTIDRTLPLIRYNLHDRVKILEHQAMEAILRQSKVENQQIFQLLSQWERPFVLVGSRSDVAVNYYGINIYYDHIRNITEDASVASVLSGNYVAYIENVYNDVRQNFHIEFELIPGARANAEMEHKIKAASLRVLTESSSEFRKLHADLQAKAHPIVRMVQHGELKANDTHVGIYAVKGKKPRMINNLKHKK